MFRAIVILGCCMLGSLVCRGQSNSQDSLPKFDSYQIYLTKPAKEIKQLLYDNDCTPINGGISDNKKGIIMHGYEPGKKVYVRIIYDDGTEDEFVCSPCFIDPVIL